MASIMEGPLSKWTNVMKGWQYRWFVLDYNAGLLSYYTSKDKMMRGSRRGCVRLRGAVIGIDDEDDSTFTITVDQKTFHFQARDADEREKWIHALEETIVRHTLQLQGVDSGFVPSIQDFDKKLAESDAYLQILIDQIKLFDDKIQNCKEDDERKKIENLKETTCGMVESIKHCIVLLQIAKSTINPVDSIYQLNPLEASVIRTMPTQTVPESVQLCKGETRPSSLAVGPVVTTLGNHQTPTPNSTGSGQSAPSSSLTSPSHVNLSPNTVPDYSYSSSEDEFYDADEFYQSGTSPKRCMDSSESATALTHSSTGTSLKRPDTIESLNSSMSNGTNDADLFDSHDGDDDAEGESVEEHKSIIMHLLSQVRLGMDLTKVVLPTFILERRSLLEMYADFFAHPDLFGSIGDHKDPKDRMVQVVRWYLSAFHAGRKGSIAKKPYNPILGEVFQCHWVLPGTENDENPEPVSEGPVPWASKNNVTFLSEQVSHHPPISAFYAECYNKRIQFNAHIWTKSKFLGMSIGVHNIGQGCVSCLDYDEHYILTFPNGYGRSILTVPWVELGGECNINCSKTGYSATIAFHTKPFYGGKKHRITAEIFSPNDKKSFCSVEGEWNGVMYAKYATGENVVFIDTKQMATVKKKVRKLEDQEEYESRRLWRDVTCNLKIKDIDAATDAKHRLEERQRAEARERKESEMQWETRLFHEDGECWVYDEPLLKRQPSLKH
ncbi:oxysterol-binding protein-related protein 9 isoform X4 [Ascaphus truei]|uniref:oxysterol-binding protein-related protein 9 isoform X4 n=1 Tax=Ascaphus truei TaxID=8439 RepID=UPI003F5A104B